MEKKNLYNKDNQSFAPKTVQQAIVADIDSTYTAINFYGTSPIIPMQHQFGVKNWYTRASNLQGMAIYGNIMVCMAAKTSGTPTHYIYQISDNGLTQLATFQIDCGHANALQFAPSVESGQTYPYLYVAGLGGVCYVLSIASNYTVTLVQTITASDGQTLIGDDGYIWTSSGDPEPQLYRRVFTKFRKVSVSEGANISLTDGDIVESFDTTKIYDKSVTTAQGWLVKFGKVWFCYGAEGSGKRRGIDVYDTATGILTAEFNLTDFTSVELEDIDFNGDSMVVATYNGQLFIIRF